MCMRARADILSGLVDTTGGGRGGSKGRTGSSLASDPKSFSSLQLSIYSIAGAPLVYNSFNRSQTRGSASYQPAVRDQGAHAQQRRPAMRPCWRQQGSSSTTPLQQQHAPAHTTSPTHCRPAAISAVAQCIRQVRLVCCSVHGRGHGGKRGGHAAAGRVKMARVSADDVLLQPGLALVQDGLGHPRGAGSDGARELCQSEQHTNSIKGGPRRQPLTAHKTGLLPATWLHCCCRQTRRPRSCGPTHARRRSCNRPRWSLRSTHGHPSVLTRCPSRAPRSCPHSRSGSSALSAHCRRLLRFSLQFAREQGCSFFTLGPACSSGSSAARRHGMKPLTRCCPSPTSCCAAGMAAL